MIRAMLPKAPLRSQGASDTFLAALGESATARDLRADLGCADMPLECLSVDDDFLVINKVPSRFVRPDERHPLKYSTVQYFLSI